MKRLKRYDLVNTRIFGATTALAALESLRKCFLRFALLLCLALPALQAQNTFTGFPGGAVNHVFYEGRDNHIYELYYTGRWWYNDLTLHSGAPPAAAGSALTNWFDNASVEHVFYTSSDGNIHELFYSAGGWYFNNLTENPAISSATLGCSSCSIEAPRGVVNGSLTGFFDSRGAGSLFYEDVIGGVELLTYRGPNVPGYPPSGWYPDVPSVTEQTDQVVISCNPGYACKTGWVWAVTNSALTSFVDWGGWHHVFFLTPNGHVQEMYEGNGNWVLSWPDLTAQTGAPAAALGSSMTSFSDSLGIEHVFFQTPNGHVQELYYNVYFNQGWHTSDLTAGTTGSLPAVGALTSFWDPNSGEHVFYQSADGHIRELHNNGTWYGSDLTTAAGAPSWGPGTAAATSLTSYVDNSHIMHVFYRSEFGHVIELYNNGKWWSNDLTIGSGGPLAQ